MGGACGGDDYKGDGHSLISWEEGKGGGVMDPNNFILSISWRQLMPGATTNCIKDKMIIFQSVLLLSKSVGFGWPIEWGIILRFFFKNTK